MKYLGELSIMQIMSIIDGKKLETVPVKFSENAKAELQRIAESEDRGVGYIVRELAMRGLALYKQDGQLKINADEEKAIANGNSKTQARQRKPEIPAGAKLNFSGKTTNKRTNKQKEAELKKQMSKAVADMEKESE